MDIKCKIEDIIHHIFKKYGEYQTFPEKDRLLIHDNIHGTLEFNKSERKIINSPLLQRLTHIRQMGLANYVYPGAVHNRFTHSLGVAHLAGEIYKSVKKDKLNKQELISLRLAGLLHDIGHGPFSHVTDTKLFKLLVDLPEDRKRKIRIDYDIYYLPKKLAKRKNIHEIISFHMIRSEPIQEFISNIYSTLDPKLNLVSLCITDNEMPYPDENGNYQGELSDDDKLLSKIINGFSDADKIDYILRDSKFSGLPLPIDFDRLLPFFTSIKFKNYFELGVFEKGARAFHLLLQSKSKMFPTVYQHHTTLACENMLQYGIINAMENLDNFVDQLDKDLFIPIEGPLDLLYYTDNSLLNYLEIIKNPISNDVVSRLYTRRHYRRVLQLFFWYLKKKLYISYDEYFTNYTKYGNGKKLKDTNNKDELFDEFIENQEKKIYDFPELFSDYYKKLDFKKEIISHLKWNDILNLLPKTLHSLDKEVLIDYIMRIEISDKFEIKPYLQPYVMRKDVFTGKMEYLYLKEMGFKPPNEEEHIQYIFYVLPELKDLLGRHIRKYVKSFLGVIYFN